MWQARQWQPVIDPLSVVMRGGLVGAWGRTRGSVLGGARCAGGGCWEVGGLSAGIAIEINTCAASLELCANSLPFTLCLVHVAKNQFAVAPSVHESPAKRPLVHQLWQHVFIHRQQTVACSRQL